MKTNRLTAKIMISAKNRGTDLAYYLTMPDGETFCAFRLPYSEVCSDLLRSPRRLTDILNTRITCKQVGSLVENCRRILPFIKEDLENAA
ncbi:MAG: hypothetical protein IK093_14325 [Ruminiclostridium sp.]|nr:hypothetical protein [Ruminiclostridium sp.]